MSAMPNIPGYMGQVPGLPQAQSDSSSTDSGSGWIGGWWLKKKESESTSSGSETKILESFNAPPVPNFESK
nr:mitochondrial import inner membrane translocase subunit tim17-2 [Quercus suber]